MEKPLLSGVPAWPSGGGAGYRLEQAACTQHPTSDPISSPISADPTLDHQVHSALLATQQKLDWRLRWKACSTEPSHPWNQ